MSMITLKCLADKNIRTKIFGTCIYKKKCGMIAEETTLQQRPDDTEI